MAVNVVVATKYKGPLTALKVFKERVHDVPLPVIVEPGATPPPYTSIPFSGVPTMFESVSAVEPLDAEPVAVAVVGGVVQSSHE